MLPVLCRAAVAVVRDGGAGEVKGASVCRSDDVYGVGVVDVDRGAGDFEGGDLDGWVGKGAEECGEVLGFEERFIALDVDVDIGVEELRDGMDAVGAAGQLGRRELDRPVVGAADVDDLVGVGSDDDLVELGAGARRIVDPGEHGTSGDVAQDFAGQAGGGEAGRNDAESGWPLSLNGLLLLK